MAALGGYDGSDPGNGLEIQVVSEVHQEEGGTVPEMGKCCY